MREVADSRIAELKEKPFTYLARLEKYTDEQIVYESAPATVAVWKDALTEHELRVVVQVYRHIPFGVRVMETAGFRIADSGELQDLSNEDLEEFS